jgi:hypothetical protein
MITVTRKYSSVFGLINLNRLVNPGYFLERERERDAGVYSIYVRARVDNKNQLIKQASQSPGFFGFCLYFYRNPFRPVMERFYPSVASLNGFQ